ncbi:hypothetical protein J2847_006198 [Azospirillum agricola]|uniref:hypothetical protein n=1 Tax=Azospirillum agricola TaxID=1720247 RepID=UPI001AE8F0B9|nr:hypothetical protein [Azospirillum agricola]MBP2232864.1 hypothetical protein [Azospirillum agricola]
MQQPETHPTPEERAARIIRSFILLTAARKAQQLCQDAIAAAIRSASDAARADEREACAKVADDAYDQATTAIKNAPLARIPALAVKFCQGRQQEAKDIADAIRARSTETGHG